MGIFGEKLYLFANFLLVQASGQTFFHFLILANPDFLKKVLQRQLLTCFDIAVKVDSEPTIDHPEVNDNNRPLDWVIKLKQINNFYLRQDKRAIYCKNNSMIT